MIKGMRSFSERHGFKQSKLIVVRDDAPKSLRTAFLQITRCVARGYLGGHPEEDVRDLIFETLDRRVDPSPWPFESTWRQVEDAVHECYWASIYELMEAVHAHFDRASPAAALELSEQLNTSLIQKGIGWQLSNGRVEIRIDEAFEQTLHVADAQLIEGGSATAVGYIRSAMKALSGRPVDTIRAVIEATNAVDVTLTKIAGQGISLDEYLSRKPDLFSALLKESLNGIYSFARKSGAGKTKDSELPRIEEAHFAVMTCAAACTLLVVKGLETAL